MKRFFCPECNKIKWARKWPADIVNQHSGIPRERIGTCKYHRFAVTVATKVDRKAAR